MTRPDTALRRWVRSHALALLAFLLSAPIPSAVHAEGLPVGWSWSSADGTLTFTVDALDLVEDVTLTVTRRADRRVLTWEFSDMAPGTTQSVQAPMPDRTSELAVRITGTFAGNAGVLEDAFTIEVLAPMDFTVDEATFDAEGHRFTMTMTQPAGHVELVVRGDTGALLAERTLRFAGEPPGAPLDVTWAQADGTILTVDVKAVSTSGAWASRTYIPWKVEFDAAHVNFATGSSAIPEADQPMLRARLDEIRATADRVREWVEVKLYIAGYTDTVGNGADNHRLSEDRARAIAQFFLSEGVTFPVYYQGFGEFAPAVPTADGVDEPANRRAVFIMSTQVPPTDATTPRSAWTLIAR